MKVTVDNQGAPSKNPVNRQRSKHIDIKYHFVREMQAKGIIELAYCPTQDMVADIQQNHQQSENQTGSKMLHA